MGYSEVDPQVDALFRVVIRWLIIANCVLGVFTLFNLYIYPEFLYSPVLSSPHVDTLHPFEI